MYKTISSRLSARFQVDGSHLHRYLSNASLIKRAILEDLILHDQVFIPTPDFLTADGLILLLGERGMIELLEAERLKFVRTRSGLGFVRGKGNDGCLAVFSDPNNKRPQDADLEKSIAAGLSVIEEQLKERNLISRLLFDSSINVETTEILQAVRSESIADFKRSAMWKPEFDYPDEGLVSLPGIEKMGVKVIGMDPDPLGNPIDTLLEITSYNSDLFLAQRFETQNSRPYYPIGDFLRMKSRPGQAEPEALWTLFEVNDLPDFSSIDLAEGDSFQLIHKATKSKKAESFRKWFHSRQGWSEKEILWEYISVIQQVPWTQKLPTRVLRFIVTGTLGLLPGVGHAASFVDAFLIDRAFQNDSPKFFIDDLRQLSKTKGLQQWVHPTFTRNMLAAKASITPRASMGDLSLEKESAPTWINHVGQVDRHLYASLGSEART
jgi:hypothetical protein